MVPKMLTSCLPELPRDPSTVPKARQKNITPRVFVPGLDNSGPVVPPVGDAFRDIGGVVRPLHLLVAGDGRLQGRLEDVVWDKVAAKVKEVVNQLNSPFSCGAFTQHRLHLGVTWVDRHREGKTHQGGEEGSRKEVNNCPRCHLPIELGIQASRAGDEAGNDQGQDHEFEEAHEELARVGEEEDGGGGQEERAQANAETCSNQNPKKSEDQEQIGGET